MKRIILITFMAFMFTNVAFPQINQKKLEEAVDKAMRAHEAQSKKVTKSKSKVEQGKLHIEQAKTNIQTQQLQRQYENNFQRQMNSLNQTTAGDYMNPPLQQGNNYNTKTGKFDETQTPKIVATPKRPKTCVLNNVKIEEDEDAKRAKLLKELEEIRQQNARRKEELNKLLQQSTN